MSDLATNLKRLRRLEALSQRALAQKAGIAYAAVARIELDQYAPRPSTITKLCTALGCRPRDLLLPGADDSAA